jgi:glycosyltransferase involved in cell wall biosynthesis
MLFSVCIPAYNRAETLPDLLDSVLTQAFADYEIVICEDQSPQRAEIRAIVQRYRETWPERIRYVENEQNLGYDGNLRRLVQTSMGDYCLFMGNDDLMTPESLSALAGAIRRHPNVGVVVRSYQSFEGDPRNIVQTFRYFPQEVLFPAGADTVVTAYRRSVVIPGMVVHREAAQRLATGEFDGTLLYQLHLVANILVEMNAVFLPQIVVLYRNGGVPDFGNSAAERGKFVPKRQTVESSVEFVRGMLAIATSVEQKRGLPVVRRIVADIANYSYPLLAIQRHQTARSFIAYWRSLSKLGLGSYPLFHLYFVALLLLGTKRTDAVITHIKRRLGYTPAFGSIHRGGRS